MIKVAIIGGGIGAEHLAAYAELPEFQVVMLVDQDADRRATLAVGGIQAAETIDAALASDADIIDICLPPHLHASVAIAALEAGKHVICEKPLATSIEDATAIKVAADAAGRHVFPVFQYRFGPAFAQLQALIDAGLTGAPRAAALETHWNRGADYYDIAWRGTWAGEQGGAALCHAIHAHDLLAHFMAPVTAVTARLGTMVNPIETEDTGALVFELAGGALATSSITLGSATDESRLRFVYEHLTATSGTEPYAPGAGAWRFEARDPAQQEAVDACAADAPIGFVGFLAQIAKAVAGQPNHAVTLTEGMRSIELVTAIYASQRRGATVPLPLSDNDPMRKGWLP